MKLTTIGFSLLALLAFESCATVEQKLSLAPLAAKFPVSASRSLYDSGKIIGEEKILDAKAFAFQKIVKIPLSKKESSLDVTPELQDLLAGTDYTGISQLQVSVVKIDSSAPAWVVAEQSSGILLGLLGGLLIAFDPPTSGTPNINDGAPSSGLLVPGSILAGSGVLLFAGSFLHANLGTVDYTLGFSGMKVKY